MKKSKEKNRYLDEDGFLKTAKLAQDALESRFAIDWGPWNKKHEEAKRATQDLEHPAVKLMGYQVSFLSTGMTPKYSTEEYNRNWDACVAMANQDCMGA